MKLATIIAGLMLVVSGDAIRAREPTRTRPGGLRVPSSGEPSASVGAVHHGRLVHPAVLTSTSTMRVRDGANFGTQELVTVISRAVAAVNARFPKTPVLTVGDLSREGGGFLSGHQSHQAGRDADLGFYMADGRARRTFEKATPKSIDAARMWTLLEAMLDSGELEYAFIAYPLQKPIYEYARDVAKVSEARLAYYFQYPRKVSERVGIIRHIPNHANHLHVRVHARRSVARGEAWAAARPAVARQVAARGRGGRTQVHEGRRVGLARARPR